VDPATGALMRDAASGVKGLGTAPPSAPQSDGAAPSETPQIVAPPKPPRPAPPGTSPQ
jgi:hypothetical protein